jgi:hypothetical protein
MTYYIRDVIRPMMHPSDKPSGIRNWCYVCLRVPLVGYESQAVYCQRNGHPKEGCMEYPPEGTLVVWNEKEMKDVREA